MHDAHAHASWGRAPVHSLRFCARCSGTQAAFDKVHSRVRYFDGVFTFTVVKERPWHLRACSSSCAVRPPTMQACILTASLHGRSLSLATTTTSSFFSGAARCALRPRPPPPILHVLPASLHVTLCCADVHLTCTHARPCSTLAYMHTHRAFACTRLAPRPRAISAIIEYVLLAQSSFRP